MSTTKEQERYQYIIRNANQFSIVKCDDILFCMAESGYTTLHTIGGEQYMMSKSLKKAFIEIGYPFLIRVSQSALVNTRHIKHVHNKSKCIVLRNGTTINYTLGYGELQMLISTLLIDRRFNDNG